jgi:asparagine synthase (glutamine-hydrolysing)
MGHEQATDVKIAKKIAQDLGLEHRVVSLQVDDYFDENTIDKIIHATSGTKTLANWHTYIYVKKLAFPSDHIHYVGSNGELARSYYLDKGIITKALQLFDFGLFNQYFSLKLKKGDNYVLSSINDQVKREQVLKIIASTCPALAASDKLDYFYTFQRVRNFIGNGIALYNLNIAAESPFLDERFIRLGFGLKRKWKLNSLFHKMAIQKLYTKLLEYPNTESTNHIRSYDTNFYWTKSESSVGYNITPKIFENKTMKASVMDSNELKPWISSSEREDLFNQKKYRTLSFLVMLQHTIKKVASIEKQKLKQIV